MIRKSAIFITGSGKCGTSLVAHSFFSSGFLMGSEADLIIVKGDRRNITGYWEHAAILDIDREILAQNGADWAAPPTTLPLRIDDALRARMRALVETLPDRFCCKEPRLVWTADLWAECFSGIIIVAVFRNPIGFRRSIANVWPHQFSADSGDLRELHIWEASNARLLDLARRFPCYWVCFDDPAERIKQRLKSIIGRLGGNFDGGEFDSFFIPAERRFSSESDLNASMHKFARPFRQVISPIEGRIVQQSCHPTAIRQGEPESTGCHNGGVPKDGTAFQRAPEIGRGNGGPGNGVDLKEARGEQSQAEIVQRLDRLVANQKELDARLWALEDSRVFRILQRIGRVCSLVKERTARLVNPGALAREKHRQYRLWLEGQQSREMDLAEPSYRPSFKVITVGDEPAASLNRMAEESGSDYLVFLSPKSTLAINALFELAAELQNDRFEVLYADEDHVSPSGERKDPIFKPEWSPDLSFSPLYMGRFLVVSAIAFQAAGGFRGGAKGAYLFDLALRLTAQPVRFHRVPRILVSIEDDRTRPESARPVLEHFIAERGLAATVEPSEHGFTIRRKVRGSPLVSIVICSRRAMLLKKCLDAIDQTTAYPHRETIIVEHMAEDKNKLDRLLADSRCNRVSYSGRFDFAAMNNLGAKVAKGDIILLLNDDARPLCDSWLEAMVAQVQRPEVGVVGALLLYPSGAIQHAGIAVGLMGAVGHPGRGTLDGGFWPWTTVTRNVSAVTGACIAIRREVFEELGGFDPKFPVNFNDVDLCLRAREAGYEVILEAGARLCHIESGTRPLGVAWEERELFAKRWSARIGRRDPYYSSHLTVCSEDCSLASFS